MAGDYEKAVLESKKYLAVSPNNLSPRRVLVASYVEMGRMEDAQQVVEEILEIDPSYRSTKVRNVPFKNDTDRDRYFGAQAKAGLPE